MLAAVITLCLMPVVGSPPSCIDRAIIVADPFPAKCAHEALIEAEKMPELQSGYYLSGVKCGEPKRRRG